MMPICIKKNKAILITAANTQMCPTQPQKWAPHNKHTSGPHTTSTKVGPTRQPHTMLVHYL